MKLNHKQSQKNSDGTHARMHAHALACACTRMRMRVHAYVSGACVRACVASEFTGLCTHARMHART